MKKNLSLLFMVGITILTLACNRNKKADNPNSEPANPTNYAVLLQWTSTDTTAVTNGIPTLSNQLSTLWNNERIQNIYLNNSSTKSASGSLPVVLFFTNANTQMAAQQMVDSLSMIKNNLGTANLIAVGDLAFGLNGSATDSAKIKWPQTYVVVWSATDTAKGIDQTVLTQQKSFDSSLQKTGQIENGYVARENANETALYFINVKDEKEANTILEKAPIVISKSGSYRLYYTGNLVKGIK